MHILDLLFPKFCVSCRRLGSYICSSCQKTIDPILSSEAICPMCELPAIGGKTHPKCQNKYSLDGLISFFHYRGAIKTAIKHIKYQYISDVMKQLIELAINSKNLLRDYPDIRNGTVVPIPLHHSRYRFRGFNQAELFTKELVRIYHFPYVRDMIRRVKSSKPQVEMKTREERLGNMKQMFDVRAGRVIPKVVILIDDVFTTGATMREAGRMLKRRGVEKVWGITIAR